MQLHLMRFVTMMRYPTNSVDITANHIPPSLERQISMRKGYIVRSLHQAHPDNQETGSSASQAASTHHLRDVNIFPLDFLVR